MKRQRPLAALQQPGLDVAAVTTWLAVRLPELELPLMVTRVGEGQSNLTFRVDDDAGRRVVLRRPPLGETLASAHDVAREHRILSSLSAAGARAPGTLALCEDTTVTGAPFYVMEYVDGLILTRVGLAEQLSILARAAVGPALATNLAELHALDVDAIGLGELVRPESLASRQLRRWTRQWHSSKTEELELIDELAERFGARLPEEREAVLLHGDYHLNNAVLDAGGAVRAVLDWELCTVGDPLADVGAMVAYWRECGSAAGQPGAVFREPVTELRGFSAASDLAETYARASGRDLAELGFWIAFAYWKIAIIIAGVYRRWLNDPSNGSGAGSLDTAIPRLAELARDALDERWEQP
jgi:aminoglycoside phosphotransferase (APT) family kinase protein